MLTEKLSDKSVRQPNRSYVKYALQVRSTFHRTNSYLLLVSATHNDYHVHIIYVLVYQI